MMSKMKVSIFTLAVGLNILSMSNASAGEIFVDATIGNKWAASCKRCVQDGNSVVISVEPQDVIVFRQMDTNTSHGVRPKNAGEDAKIRKRGDAENASQIVEEQGTGPTKIGSGDDMKFPKLVEGAAPVEMTKVKVKDNFTGSLNLWCNVHGPGMQITLKKE